MTPDLHALYVAAGLRRGSAVTCDTKIAYSSEESAVRDAFAMNMKPGMQIVLVPYPCAYCEKWHVGQKMSEAELRAAAFAPLAADELAGIPTSLLLRDVVAHGCDRLDRKKLCDRCRGKWDEIDRRLPTRTVKAKEEA